MDGVKVPVFLWKRTLSSGGARGYHQEPLSNSLEYGGATSVPTRPGRLPGASQRVKPVNRLCKLVSNLLPGRRSGGRAAVHRVRRSSKFVPIPKDVLSSLAQQRHGFGVESLPHWTASRHEERYGQVRGQRQQDALEERLRDNTQTPVPEQVCFRIDFPAWLTTLTPRERQLVREMAGNERTLDLGKRFELSPARISQLRRELHNDWRRFCGG
jgi:hypothetical protein